MSGLFARSDVDYIAIPRESGGCGAGSHSRPVSQGVRAATWELTCEPCCSYLRKVNDPLWAATLSEVPETPDESKTREDFEKRGAFDERAVTAMALAKLAGVELPDTLRRPLTGLPSHIPVVSGQVECSEGHPNEPGMKFCGECGTPLRPPAKPTCPDGHEVSPKMRFCGECGKPVTATPALEAAPVSQRKRLRDMRSYDLKVLARQKGLDDTGTRNDVIARLQAAA